VLAGGKQGSAAKWAHAAVAVASRTLAPGEHRAPDPRAVFAIVERIVRQGAMREGPAGAELASGAGRDLLEAWLRSVGVPERGGQLLARFAHEDFSHGELYRRARRVHERALRETAHRLAAGVEDLPGAAAELFAACMPVIPYLPATAFLAAEKARLSPREDDTPRVALVADGLDGVHGVSRTLEQIRDRGVPGYEVEVVGTDRARSNSSRLLLNAL